MLQRSRGRRDHSNRKASGSHPIDAHVGSRVRLRRSMLGLSQQKLGAAIGLTFQQIQKYERGANRIGASRLIEIARVLDVPVSFFFDDVDPVRTPAIPEGFPEPAGAAPADLLRQPETIELITAYYQIREPRLRQSLLGLAKALSLLESKGTLSAPRTISAAAVEARGKRR